MHKKLKEHSVWTDMNIFGELLGNVIQDIYGKETLTLIEEIRVFAKNNLEETALDKLFYQLESLPEERVQIILRAFGLFLGILTIIQRAYKVKDYEEYQGLTLDFDFIGDQDVLPSIHLVFCSHVAETLSAETVASFQHLFDIIYHYRKLTHEPFDEQTIKMMTFVIRELLTKPLHSDDHSLEDDMLRLMAYFKTSLYPSVGILFAKARTEHIPMLGSILKYSTWIGADHEVLTMKTELTTQAVDLYRETLKSCYLDSLDFIESLIAVDPHLLTPSLTAEFHELKQLVTDLPLSSFLLEEMKVRTDKLLDAFQCSKPDALVTQRCFQFRCQIEVFGQYGLVLEQKFDAQRLVLLMESLYQKLFQRRLLRLFEDSPLDLLDLDSKITSADLKNILLLLPVNQQAQWHALSQPHAQTDLSIERIIVTNVSSLYQLMAIRVLLGLIKNTKSFITPVFETIDSIDHSTNIIVTYLEYCKTLKVPSLLDQVMMGYTDSAREASFWTAQTKIYHAQYRIAAWAAQQGLKISFFQGRGGSIACGGFPTKPLIATTPLSVFNPSLKLTIQDEVLQQRFGSPEIAAMSMKRYLLEIKEALKNHHDDSFSDEMMSIRDQLAACATKEFQYYTQEERDFFDYFYACTPVDLCVDSLVKPTYFSDKYNAEFIKSLPWSLAWAQNRFLIPVWLGMDAVCHYLQTLDSKNIDKIFSDRFVYSTFMLVLLSLAKTELELVRQYEKQLVSPHLIELGQALKLVHKQLVDCSQQFIKFYRDDAYFNNFIEDAHYRAGYLVPLHLLQIEMIRRYRSRKDIEALTESAFLESTLLISMGLQNSG